METKLEHADPLGQLECPECEHTYDGDVCAGCDGTRLAFCQKLVGANARCGDPATEVRDEYLCAEHAAYYDALDAQAEAEERHEREAAAQAADWWKCAGCGLANDLRFSFCPQCGGAR